MSQYCDTKILENNWYDWVVASATPKLEKFRKLGILWTKVNGKVLDSNGNIITKSGRSFSNPYDSNREHLLLLASPIHFLTDDFGNPTNCKSLINGEVVEINLDEIESELNLQSEHWIHSLENIEILRTYFRPLAILQGFKEETPTELAWHQILDDINKMCQGIATKFNPPTKEEHLELSHDAFLQVINKLVRQKLMYMPGKAPVFNLLTTTIYRCMYSIKNKQKNQRNSMHKLINDVQSGVLSSSMRSLKNAVPVN